MVVDPVILALKEEHQGQEVLGDPGHGRTCLYGFPAAQGYVKEESVGAHPCPDQASLGYRTAVHHPTHLCFLAGKCQMLLATAAQRANI